MNDQNCPTNYNNAGITRQTVLTLASELGLPIFQNPMYATQLRHFDELFVTSTTCEITPVVKVDDLLIGTGQAGEVTRGLQARLLTHVQMS